MDSTLLRKSPGEWPDLEESGSEEDNPVRLPLFTWLRSGGSLLVVTSDDGHRPWRQLMRQIPPELRGSVVLSTADGAVLSSLQSGEYTEEQSYWGGALLNQGVGSTGLPASDLTTEIACEMKRSFLADCMSDAALLATVSPVRTSNPNHNAIFRVLLRESACDCRTGGRRATPASSPNTKRLRRSRRR